MFRKSKTLVAVGMTAMITVPASAELRFDNNSGGYTLLYGQLDPAYLSFDDGVNRKGTIVDNTNSNSRVGLWYRQPLDGGNEFSFNFESALGLRPSAAVSQNFTPKGIDWRRTNIRKVDFSLKTANAGRFSAGQGSMATDGVAEVDLSGTSLVTYVSIPDTAGSFRFRDTSGALSGPAIGGVFGDFDGGRRGRVRYDSPTIAGFTLSASYGEEILVKGSNLKTKDIAVRYGADYDGTKVKAALGYAITEPGSGVERKDTIGSVSVLLESGLNFTLAAGDRNVAGHYGYGKVGYIGDWFNFGRTAVSLDYYNGTDRSVAGSKSKSYGLGVVQKIKDANTEVYLGVRNYSLSEPGVDYHDAQSVLFGTRWKF